MAKIETNKALTGAFLITIAGAILNWAVSSLLGQTIKPLFAITLPQLYTPITSSIGNKIIAWITGVIPFEQFVLPAMAITFISAFVILITGEFIISAFKLPTLRDKEGQLVSKVLWGAVPWYLLIVGFAIPAIGMMGIVGLLIYTYVLAFVAGFLAKLFKISV